MSAPDPRIAEYGRQLFVRLGDRALSVARDMIAHLIAIGDRERADDWHHIFAAIEDARREPATAHAAEKPGPTSPADLWLRTLKELEEIGRRRLGAAAKAGAEAPGNACNNRPIVERGEAPTN